jgi:serine beta-lactamase-like protein LACTB
MVICVLCSVWIKFHPKYYSRSAAGELSTLKVRGITILVVIAFIASAGVLTARQAPSAASTNYSKEISAAKEAASQSYEHGFAAANGALYRSPAFSWAIAVDGKLVAADAYGFADLEERLPATTETKFRIGSVSKTLTTAGLAALYEQGKLDLDVPIQRYVPKFPDKGHPITLRELAGHLGGIRNYLEGDFLPGQDNQKHYDNLQDALAIFAKDPLVEVPGAKFNYSVFGFCLIGMSLETASGESFPAFMHDRIFAPLGMRNTTTDENFKLIDHRTRFYDLNSDGSFRNANYIDSSYKWPAGGFLSTPSDLAVFGAALARPGFLKASTLALLFTAQRTSAGESTGYGMGWFVHEKGQSKVFPEHMFNHGGDIEGGQATIAIFPDYNIVVAYAMNTDSVNARGAATALLIAQPFIDRKKRGN